MTNDTRAPTDPFRDAPVYDSGRIEIPFFSEARALWEYRHLVRELISRDVKVRYKRSVLGVAWTMLNPLLNMVALTVVFSVILRQGIEHFPVYFLGGVLFWNFFSQATGHAAALSVDAAETTRRVYVPRSVFVVAAVGVGLVNLAFSLGPLVLIVAVTGHPFHATWLFLPVAVLLGAMFCTGVGLVVFTLASRFADVRETYMTLLTPWLFLTPIMYEPSLVPEHYRWIVRWNPMTYLVEVFRAPIYNGWLPGRNTLAFAVVAAVASLALGWAFYASRIEEYGRGA
jgi:ABC-type polysaccharide/polyol phosphate export permease